MKKYIRSLSVLLGFSAPLFSQTFTIRVPARSVMGAVSPVPIGRIRITLETSGGGTLNVTSGANSTGATAFPAMADVTVAMPPGPPPVPDNRDRVTITARGGNVYEVEIRRRRQFVTPGQYCALSDFTDQDYSFVIVGTTTSAYRLSSYSVAAATTDAADLAGVNCGILARLIGTSPAFASTPPPVAVVYKGRHPLEAFLVLDKSGSMEGNSGRPGVKRIDALKSATSAFLTLWKAEPSPGNVDISGDKLGLIFYESAVDGPGGAVLTCGNALVARGPGGGVHPWNALDTKVNACATGNLTAMGPALQDAFDQLTSVEDKSILLMTDGLQNVPSTSGPGSVETGPGPEFITSLNTVQLSLKAIPIQTLGLGAGADIDKDLLDHIAKQTTGQAAVVWADEVLAGLPATLVNILKGNSLALVSRTQGTLPAQPPVTSQVELDPSISRVVFLLYHEAPATLSATSPGGQATRLIVIGSGQDWTAYQLDGIQAQPGRWTLQVGSPSINAVVQTGKFSLSTYAYETKLDFSIDSVGNLGTGNPARFFVDLGFAKKPLTGLPAGIRLQVARPGEGFGTILHDTQVPASVLQGGPIHGDVNSPYSNKINYLVEQGKLAERLAPKPLPNLLSVTELHNGLYQVTFNDMTMPGRHKFRFILEWDDPRTGKMQREETVERIVSVTPSAANSPVTVTPQPRGGWLLSVTPRDRFGNYAGPGLGNRIKVTASNGTVATLTDPQQTGVYTALVTTPGNVRPVVNVNVDGVPLKVGDGHKKKWWLIVLVIAVAGAVAGTLASTL